MKKIVCIFLSLLMLLPFCLSAVSADASAVVLSTREELLEWASNVNDSKYKGKIIKLGADITVAEGDAKKWFNYESAPSYSQQWKPIVGFTGIFDGDGHTISGLYTSAELDNVGFFKELGKGSVVKNLSIKNSYFETSANNAGSIVGLCYDAAFENIYSDAYLRSKTSAGGVIGTLPEGANPKVTVNLLSCWFDGHTETSGRYSGGMIGHQYHNYAVITDCLNTGIITCGTTHAAGISPGVYEGWLIATGCVNLGTITQNFKTVSELGQAITYTIGSSNKRADDIVILDDCFGLEGKSKLEPEDVRNGSIISGGVDNLTKENMKQRLSVLKDTWYLDGEIPVPKYFAPKGAVVTSSSVAATTTAKQTASSATSTTSAAATSSVSASSSAAITSAVASRSVTSPEASLTSATPSRSVSASTSDSSVVGIVLILALSAVVSVAVIGKARG